MQEIRKLAAPLGVVCTTRAAALLLPQTRRTGVIHTRLRSALGAIQPHSCLQSHQLPSRHPHTRLSEQCNCLYVFLIGQRVDMRCQHTRQKGQIPYRGP